MHPRVAELVDLLTRNRAGLLASVAAVPAESLERRAAPGVWTVAEVLDHLQLVEAGSARLLARRLQRAREAGLGAETDESSLLANAASRYAGREGIVREAPELVRPREGVDAESALTGLQQSREALLEVVRDGDGLALGEVRANHAAFGELDLYQWLHFIADHEAHHEAQIRRIGAALAGEGGANP